jgi:NADH-quinone oxidoreductase subunit M
VTDIIGPSVNALVSDFQAALPADPAAVAMN